jgi:glucose/arabinose dehydrogenase
MIRTCLSLLAASSLACTPAPETPNDPTGAGQTGNIRLQEVASGLSSPVFLVSPPGDRRVFVIEKPGRIRIIDNGTLISTPYLDITERVGAGGNEQGLLGLAFHPGYASNGYFFVNYTDTSGDTRIERYRVGPDRNRADAASAKRLLAIDQPYSNHNGGMIAFGPDGMLYIGMGDGGSGGDPQGHGQNMNSLLGKILRIDVDRGDPYGIPAGNPFVGQAGRRGEIWASGVRNPWRFSFDPASGMLYVADVGQNTNEEINVVPASAAGLNYGWNRMEAKHCFPPSVTTCDQTGLQIPQVEYPRSQGFSVTGGYVYRGRAISSLAGHYFYADFGQPGIRSFRFADGRVQDERQWELPEATSVSSFGQDSEGELYVVSLGGRVFKIVPA